MEEIKNPGQQVEQKEIPKEIERKFLVASLPENLEKYPNKEITQGYLAITPDGTEVRLRKKGSKYFQTVKTGGGKVRGEFETEITEDQFNVFWQATEGKRVEKTRYEIVHEESLIELDVYRNNLENLLSAEVEFKTEKESDQFVAPELFGNFGVVDESNFFGGYFNFSIVWEYLSLLVLIVFERIVCNMSFIHVAESEKYFS